SGGFTTGTPWSVFAPGQATANVAAQTSDPTSLLSRYRNLIRARKGSQALTVGQGLEVLTPMYGFYQGLVFVRTHGSERVVVAHNLAGVPAGGTFALRAGSLQPLFIDPGASASMNGPGSWTISLPAYGSAVWREQP
ncbi:MAG TPA: alpha-amylase, partial [Myxococcales bacterium]|nr:alpha-amylase [Myxococcales bacterium]